MPPHLTSVTSLAHESNGVHSIAWQSVNPDCCHSHICFLERRRGSLQRAPSGERGACALEYEASSLRLGACWRGLFSKTSAEDVLRG